MHARVGIYRLISGTAEEVATIAEDGMLPIFPRQSGFISYEALMTEDAILSISRWESAEGADAATAAAASFVKKHLADRIELQQAYVGDLRLLSPS